MTTRISQTGIRRGEFITSSASATQNKGVILQVRGFYPPSRKWIGELNPLVLRDEFNQFPFFAPMSPEQRWEWLQANATDDPDLYMEDVPDLAIKIIAIESGTTKKKEKGKGKEKKENFFLEALTPEQLTQLKLDNPQDPEGY